MEHDIKSAVAQLRSQLEQSEARALQWYMSSSAKEKTIIAEFGKKMLESDREEMRRFAEFALLGANYTLLLVYKSWTPAEAGGSSGGRGSGDGGA